MKYCPECNRYEHQEEANFCYLCGSKLESAKLNELYLRLKIPENKIVLELHQKKHFIGFPLFLRKESVNGVEAITMHEYPTGVHLIAHKPNCHKIFADKTDKILITPEGIEKLLAQGFKWYHESEMSLLW